MEYLKERWEPSFNDGSWYAVAVQTQWYMFETCKDLPFDVTGEKTCRAICDMHNAQLDAAPKQLPGVDDAEAKRKEQRRHDDAAAFMAASIRREGLANEEQAWLAKKCVRHADALQAALEKGGAE